jgi:HEAT repeat protein
LKYTKTIEPSDRRRAFELLGKMEQEYEKRNAAFFNKVLSEDPSLSVRVHAVTVLSEIGDKSSISVLADVMKNDPSSLMRHEAAFSLGQLGLGEAVPYLIDAALNDSSEIVRHESAAALGGIGDERAREALVTASKDPSEEVRGSAIASLFNLDYLAFSSKKKQDAEALAKEINRKKKAISKRKKKMPHP